MVLQCEGKNEIGKRVLQLNKKPTHRRKFKLQKIAYKDHQEVKLTLEKMY